MRKSSILILAGAVLLTACSEPAPAPTPAPQEPLPTGEQIAAMVAPPQPIAEPRAQPGGVGYRKIGRVDTCNLYEIQWKNKTYILAAKGENSGASSMAVTCSITPS